jgi:hypothetical protein
VFDRFHRTVLDDGSVPVIVLFPNRTDVIRHHRGEARRYQPLIDEFNRNGYAYVDLLDGLIGLPSDSLFADGGHYAPSGNATVAAILVEYLHANGLDSPSAVADRVAEARSGAGRLASRLASRRGAEPRGASPGGP